MRSLSVIYYTLGKPLMFLSCVGTQQYTTCFMAEYVNDQPVLSLQTYQSFERT